MTLHRWESNIETFKGTGRLLRKGDVIGQASYDLCVETEGITAKSFLDEKTRLTRKNVTGLISLLDGAMLPGENPITPQGSFILVLEDGREVDFRVESCTVESNPARQECRIRGSGNRF